MPATLFANLAGCQNLTELTCCPFHGTAEMIRALADLRGVRKLTVFESEDHWLRQHLGEFARAEHLEQLDLRGAVVPGDELAALRVTLPNCTIRVFKHRGGRHEDEVTQ